jgi:hypothetical protein
MICLLTKILLKPRHTHIFFTFRENLAHKFKCPLYEGENSWTERKILTTISGTIFWPLFTSINEEISSRALLLIEISGLFNKLTIWFFYLWFKNESSGNFSHKHLDKHLKQNKANLINENLKNFQIWVKAKDLNEVFFQQKTIVWIVWRRIVLLWDSLLSDNETAWIKTSYNSLEKVCIWDNISRTFTWKKGSFAS